jgi:hypothetical protein
MFSPDFSRIWLNLAKKYRQKVRDLGIFGRFDGKISLILAILGALVEVGCG